MSSEIIFDEVDFFLTVTCSSHLIMSIIHPKSQRGTFSMLVPRELGYPKTFSTKIGFSNLFQRIACPRPLFTKDFAQRKFSPKGFFFFLVIIGLWTTTQTIQEVSLLVLFGNRVLMNLVNQA